MIELALLGTPELLRSGDISDAVLVQPRRLALLAYLAASHGELQRRDRLLLLFWGDQPQARARASLRQALYFLRRSLGENLFVTRGDDEIGLNVAEARFDVTEFEQAIAEGRPEAALSLYRGDFLADFNITDAPEFERWASERRRELRRTAVGAAWTLADDALAAGSREASVRWTRRAIDLSEYAESDVHRGMRLAADAGDGPTALELYAGLEGRLAADLETTPGAATTELARELRQGQPDATPIIAWGSAQENAGSPPRSTPATPSTISPGRSTSSVVRVRAALLTALVAACLVGGLILYRQRLAHARDMDAADRVAVFPFAVRSRGGQAAYLREGAATLLGLALDGAGRLRTVDANAVLSASAPVMDVEGGRRTAQSLNAGQFVIGEIEEVGTRLSVAVTLYDLDGRTRTRATATGDESRVFDLVDSLARRLAVGAMTDSTVRLANAAAASTRSLVAFKSFLAGETQMRSGHYREAVAEFQSAVASDSTFGLAYYRLSLAREWTDGEISSDSAAALAEHFSKSLPDRDRKLLAARRAFVRRDLATGERLANQVLAIYPTDADAWAQLGELRFHLGPNVGHAISESRDQFLHVLRYRPNDLSARVHLTRIAALEGDSAHVDEWSGRETVFGDASEIGTYELAAMRAVVLGDPKAKAAFTAATQRANDATVASAVWRIATYARDFEAAAAIAAARRGDGFASRADVLLTDIARGRLAPPRDAEAAVLTQHATLLALMFAMPSTPDVPATASRVHQDVARVANGAANSSSDPALAATRLIEAKYGDRLAPATLTAKLSPADQRTVQRIAIAMHSIAKAPTGALSVVSPDSLDDVSVNRLGLYDLLASVRAEALHALGRDAEAITWLNAIGLSSASSSANVPLAIRRKGQIEELTGSRAAATRDAGEVAKMWQGADAELRTLARSGKSEPGTANQVP
ncbi:hypothetical protein BH09GEM1_BH09GEM1_43440 [soil metagenome]